MFFQEQMIYLKTKTAVHGSTIQSCHHNSNDAKPAMLQPPQSSLPFELPQSGWRYMKMVLKIQSNSVRR